MLNKSNIQLPIEQLLKDYPKTKEKILITIKNSLLAFQETALGAGAKAEDVSLSKMDLTLLEGAANATLQLNPRMLYEIFDEMDIFISVKYNKDTENWAYWNSGDNISGTAISRNQAESEAFQGAFKITERIL